MLLIMDKVVFLLSLIEVQVGLQYGIKLDLKMQLI